MNDEFEGPPEPMTIVVVSGGRLTEADVEMLDRRVREHKLYGCQLVPSDPSVVIEVARVLPPRDGEGVLVERGKRTVVRVDIKQ